MKIMLDAGHGYNTSGKRSPDGMKEYEFNRAVAAYTRNLLENYQNVTIYYAHSDQTDIPLYQRTNKANNLKVDLYISIHANAYGSGWNSASGIETYVYPSRTKREYDLAQKIQSQLIADTGLRNRGVKTANFHVLRETNMTSVLIECGFMTNATEIKLLRSDSYRRKCAEAITKAVVNYYGLKKKQTPAPVLKGLYKVQVGAFKQKANAEALAESLKKKGFTNYIARDDGFYKVQAGAFKEKANANQLQDKLRKAGFTPYIFRE